MILINCVPVNFYGETEVVFGAIKLTTIVGLILLMLIIDLGGRRVATELNSGIG